MALKPEYSLPDSQQKMFAQPVIKEGRIKDRLVSVRILNRLRYSGFVFQSIKLPRLPDQEDAMMTEMSLRMLLTFLQVLKRWN